MATWDRRRSGGTPWRSTYAARFTHRAGRRPHAWHRRRQRRTAARAGTKRERSWDRPGNGDRRDPARPRLQDAAAGRTAARDRRSRAVIRRRAMRLAMGDARNTGRRRGPDHHSAARGAPSTICGPDHHSAARGAPSTISASRRRVAPVVSSGSACRAHRTGCRRSRYWETAGAAPAATGGRYRPRHGRGARRAAAAGRGPNNSGSPVSAMPLSSSSSRASASTMVFARLDPASGEMPTRRVAVLDQKHPVFRVEHHRPDAQWLTPCGGAGGTGKVRTGRRNRKE